MGIAQTLGGCTSESTRMTWRVLSAALGLISDALGLLKAWTAAPSEIHVWP